MAQTTLPQGTLNVRDTGSGEPIVFVHGLLVNGLLWRKVTPLLEADHRCIAPDWPLGSHPTPMAPDADLSPRGIANVVADAIEALNLERVTLVGNDTGGAICQLVATERPERIGRLVLTNCDAFDNFPPQLFRPLLWLARVPPVLTGFVQAGRLPAVRRLPVGYGALTLQPIPDGVSGEWLRPFLSDSGVRRDTMKTLRGIDPRDTVAAAEKLSSFDRPALLAWARQDRFFPVEHAHRLAAILPQGRVEEVPDARAFVPEDQPERLAQLIRDFIRSTPVGSSSGATV